MAKALSRRVLKATSLLGSTQVLNMVCSLVRMKLLTLWVGELGVGLMGALQQASDFIGNVTQLSMRTTAVPVLASATPSRRGEILTCIRRYGRMLGLAGALLMLVLAPWLSEFTFGSQAYSMSYRIVAVSVMLVALQGSELVALQAAGEYAAVAASSLTTAAAGLLISLPLFYFLRAGGVAPALVGYALCAFLAARWVSRRHKSALRPVAWRSSLSLGRGFIAAGAVITLSSLICDGVNFVFMGFMGHQGEEALGHFQAGYTMLWRYGGILFLSFGVEFYPRLSRAAGHPRAIRLMLTHQSMLFTLLFIPCIAAAILLAPWLVRLLFRESFMPMLPYFVIGIAGFGLRPVSTCMSYSFLACGGARYYAVTELVSALAGLGFNVMGYTLAGFTGLGVATVAWLYFDLALMLVVGRLGGAQLPRGRAIVAALLSPLCLLPLAALWL